MDTQEALTKSLAKAGSKNKLAPALGVSRRQVARWCNEGTQPSPASYGRLLEYLGVPRTKVYRLVAERELGR